MSEVWALVLLPRKWVANTCLIKLLLVAKDNKEKINILGLNDKFVEATKDKEKQNIKHN